MNVQSKYTFKVRHIILFEHNRNTTETLTALESIDKDGKSETLQTARPPASLNYDVTQPQP